jgi:hypothetical protein
MPGKRTLGKSAAQKMTKRSKKPKVRNPYSLHAKRRKAGVHQDKRKTEKAKQKEDVVLKNENEAVGPFDVGN